MPGTVRSKLVIDLKKSYGMKSRNERMPKPTEAQAAIVISAGRQLEQGMFDLEPRKEAALGVLCDQISEWSWELCKDAKIKAAKALASGHENVDDLANVAQLWDDACDIAWRVKDELRTRRRERIATVEAPLSLTKSTDNAYVTQSPERAWRRVPGSASMIAGHVLAKRESAAEKRYLNDLYTGRGMPAPKALISDGNFNTAADVVKGLGMPVADENIWASRIGKIVNGSRIETDLRKSIYATLRDHDAELPKFVKSELARRTLALYRETRRAKGDFMSKAFPPPKGKPVAGGKPGAQQGQGPKRPPKPGMDEPERVSVAPPGKDVPDFEDGQNGGTPDQRKQQHFTDPAVDVGDLEGGPVDPGIITQEVEKLHQQLHALHAHMDGTPAQIHLHNDIVARMREVYAKPDPDGLREVKHMLHHFAEIVQGPEEPAEPDMNDTGDGFQPGQAGPAAAGKGPPGAGAPKPPPKPGVPMQKGLRPFR